ncbi:hypothetical protein GCM10027343_09640 [Noviherbaspirillum agri]
MLTPCSNTAANKSGEVRIITHASFDLSFVEHGNYIHVQWKGSQTLATIQEGCQELCNLLRESGADKVLNDGRRAVGCWISSVPWIVYCFLPQARRAGMRVAAHVLAKERKSRMSAHAFRLFSDFCEWNLAFFQTIEEAQDWLASERLAIAA